MGNCNSILSIHSGIGTTQPNRVNPALDPAYFRLDERNEQDFILFVQKLSQYVTFYNEFNIAEGTWAEFFGRESTSILILIANWNIELLQSSFENKKNEILINTDNASQKAILLEYFTQIEIQFNQLKEKAALLDDNILEKEALISSTYTIAERFTYIITMVNTSSDIASLLKNYVFNKAIQQLFGLLLSWKNFTKKAVDNQLNNYPNHSPHYTLFLSFVKLLQVAKDKFNEFTKRHLDFYYKNVLKVENQKAKPDYVHLVVQPHNTKPFLIPKGTIFPAGKNGAGQKKYYSATQDQTVNGIKLSSFLSKHYSNNRFYKTTLSDLNATGKGFDAFTTNAEETREGIMIASPLLFLQSGERSIYITFNDKQYNATDFNFYITGEKEIIELTVKENEKVNSTDTVQAIKLSIPADEKAIIPYDAKLHKGLEINTSFPVLKVVPKSTEVINIVSKIDITVRVSGFKTFKIESDFGTINPEKSFYPFGEIPKSGNSFYISSNELFMKKNAEAIFGSFFFNWIFYNKVITYQLYNGAWVQFSNQYNEIKNNYPLTDYRFNEIASSDIKSNGKFRIQFNDSNYANEKYMEAYIDATKNDGTLPYKPQYNDFGFWYNVSESINLATRTNEANPVEIFKSTPFGYEKFTKGLLKFTTASAQEGFMYLGFENAAYEDGLNFLIQLEEGTANPRLEPATVKWSYLNNNQWLDIEPQNIGDETLSLTQSGLINITVPNYNSDNTILQNNLFWLRISVTNIQAVCRILGIHIQALKAVLTDYENTGTEFLEHTPKGTISKTYTAINQVKKILQPYASFGGRKAEADESLYTRISERLRHKNRAITVWDYEHIVLQEFPEVYRVKTLNHYRYDTQISNVAAGYTTVIPVAKSQNTDNISWKPLLSLNKMLLIKEHLSKKASAHARINVKAPKAEMIKVEFNVKFWEVPGMDSRLYISQLKEIINKYLSPWAYDDPELNFANEIEFSSIIQLVDNQEFVDYITNFKITQYLLDENNQISGSPIQNLNRITPQTDFTLFIPNELHLIEEIK